MHAPAQPLIAFFLFTAAVLLQPFTAFAKEAQSVTELAEQLQATYAHIGSMSFSFSQTTSGPMTGSPKTGAGKGIYAKTPEKPLMRWNYTSPEFQVVISDGETISMYFEKLNQMIITDVDKAQTDILFSVFTASEPLNRFFAILPPHLETDLQNEPSPPLQVLQLQPLDKDSQIKTIHIWIDQKSLIRRIELVDHFDTRTTIDLADIRVDPLDLNNQEDIEKRFSFTPPEGTEIIRQ
jgi:outer membrane lipoprotein carrier protein